SARRQLKMLEQQSVQNRGPMYPQIGLFDGAATSTQPATDALHQALGEIEADELSPKQALELIYKLKKLGDNTPTNN
ncbi:MAG TPA: hypothetical protein VGL10_09480, partial [Gammaproteobacteria bacterium]